MKKLNTKYRNKREIAIRMVHALIFDRIYLLDSVQLVDQMSFLILVLREAVMFLAEDTPPLILSFTYSYIETSSSLGISDIRKRRQIKPQHSQLQNKFSGHCIIAYVVQMFRQTGKLILMLFSCESRGTRNRLRDFTEAVPLIKPSLIFVLLFLMPPAKRERKLELTLLLRCQRMEDLISDLYRKSL